jgi:hypothetical protein
MMPPCLSRHSCGGGVASLLSWDSNVNDSSFLACSRSKAVRKPRREEEVGLSVVLAEEP